MPFRSSFRRSNPAAVALMALLVALHAVAPRDEAPAGTERAGMEPAAGLEAQVDEAARQEAAPEADEPHGPPPPAGPAPAVDAALGVRVADGDVALADGPTMPAGEAAAGDEPHPVQYLEVVVGGEPVALAFVDVSPPLVNGRTAVLLQGEAGDGWAPTVAALGAAGFRVIVPDLVGSGRSGRPRVTPSPDELAGHVAVLLDSLGAPDAAVVAAGADADVATRLATRWPGTRRLVLAGVDSGPAGLALPTLVVADARTARGGFHETLLAFLGR